MYVSMYDCQYACISAYIKPFLRAPVVAYLWPVYLPHGEKCTGPIWGAVTITKCSK